MIGGLISVRTKTELTFENIGLQPCSHELQSAIRKLFIERDIALTGLRSCLEAIERLHIDEARDIATDALSDLARVRNAEEVK